MRMRGTKLVRGSVRTTKYYRDIKLPARHRVHVRRVIDDLIERHQRKAERHKFNYWPQADHRCADAKTCKPVLADRSIDDSPWPKALKQPVADFVSALVFRDLFAHQKNIWITLEFLCERFIKGLTIRDFSHG